MTCFQKVSEIGPKGTGAPSPSVPSLGRAEPSRRHAHRANGGSADRSLDPRRRDGVTTHATFFLCTRPFPRGDTHASVRGWHVLVPLPGSLEGWWCGCYRCRLFFGTTGVYYCCIGLKAFGEGWTRRPSATTAGVFVFFSSAWRFRRHPPLLVTTSPYLLEWSCK